MNVTYFISYAYVAGSYSGFGNMMMRLQREIENLEDIKQIEERILNARHYSTVTIINFQIFGGQNG